MLDTSTAVVIPLGAEAKEHGPQLRLKNDFVLAEYYADRMMKASKVVVYPTMNYGFYPAFVDYPGSTTLRDRARHDRGRHPDNRATRTEAILRTEYGRLDPGGAATRPRRSSAPATAGSKSRARCSCASAA